MVHLSTVIAALTIFVTISAVPLSEIGQNTPNTSHAHPHTPSFGKKGHKGVGISDGAVSNSSAAATTNPRAIYFMTNAANNSIVALRVAADGTLSNGSFTATGGAGMQGIVDGAPAAPDALFSQGAVKVAGNVSSNTHIETCVH